MTSDEANEVLGIVRRIGPVVLSAAVDPRGTVGTALRRTVGMMVADTNMINLPTFGIALSISLDLARFSYATLVTMDRVRKAALAETPKSLPAVQTVLAIVRLTLACEARIIAFMTFRSRDEVDAVVTAMNDAFSDMHNSACRCKPEDLIARGCPALKSQDNGVEYQAPRPRRRNRPATPLARARSGNAGRQSG